MKLTVPARALCLAMLLALAALLVACGVPAPTPSPTPWPTKTPTATATPTPAPTPTPVVTPSPLDGVWQLARIEYMSGKVVTIEKPESYTVQFLREGRVQVKADCNSGVGAYQMSSEKVTIEGVSTTKMACASGSMGDLFVSTLANAAAYRVEGAELTVTLKYDGGDMVFVKAQ